VGVSAALIHFLENRTEESKMRKSLLATVAVAAVVGFGGIAAAQSQTGGDSNKGTSGAAQEQKSGEGKSGTQSGSKTLSPSGSQSSGQPSGQSAQGMEKGKQNERLGQGANQEQKGMMRGAQEEKRGMEQKGAQQERGLQKNEKGAQEEHGTKLKGAQEQRGTSTTEQSKTGVNANVGTSGSRGASVQLSEDQRSQFKTIIGKERGPRLGSNVNFDVAVGTRIPRDVHVVVLPEEIVRIVPEYRGYEYFLVGDEIVIVDPSTLEIVAIIPA
jgi:hypothetical protein